MSDLNGNSTRCHGDWMNRRLSQELSEGRPSLEQIHHEYMSLYNPVLIQRENELLEQLEQRRKLVMAYQQSRSTIDLLANYCSTLSPPASLTEQYGHTSLPVSLFNVQPETIPSWNSTSALSMMARREPLLSSVVSPLSQPRTSAEAVVRSAKRSLQAASEYDVTRLVSERSAKMPRLEEYFSTREEQKSPPPPPVQVLSGQSITEDLIKQKGKEDGDRSSIKRPEGLRHVQWQAQFQRLVNYKKENGDTLVPTNYTPDPQLGNWVRNQRLANKNGSMTEARKAKLDNIGFFWYFYDRSTTRWEEMFNRLVKYKETHGDANVPLRYPKDPQLGAWVNYQRTTRRQGKLSLGKIDKLNSLEFEWNPMKHAATWEQMFWRLLAYKNCHGDTKVPFRYKADPQLGYWVSNQRAFYRKRKLSKDRAILLESVGLFSKSK
eukprot:CAMPEP_0116134982 /NCGR_PEP_ID=MMETSP0329-20121206/10950_1 /TAXON_ID=697910 /ORGANISM="Pseudo-nitzschia arenysensis, Strain B593" /LENGTH=434 /DNA_ID=CAMNT_0003629757 /DNA_START=30 /DNA_END=1334 /DNA_ORIENTATION=+